MYAIWYQTRVELFCMVCQKIRKAYNNLNHNKRFSQLFTTHIVEMGANQAWRSHQSWEAPYCLSPPSVSRHQPTNSCKWSNLLENESHRSSYMRSSQALCLFDLQTALHFNPAECALGLTDPDDFIFFEKITFVV